MVTSWATALWRDPDEHSSPEAARSLVRCLGCREGPAMMERCASTIDLAEIQYKPLPARPPGGHCHEIDGLNARVEQLEGELARLEVEKQCLEVRAAGHRVDFERERQRCDTLMTEALKLGNLAMSAREKAARLEGELSARRSWWGWFGAQATRSVVRSPSRSPCARSDLTEETGRVNSRIKKPRRRGRG